MSTDKAFQAWCMKVIKIIEEVRAAKTPDYSFIDSLSMTFRQQRHKFSGDISNEFTITVAENATVDGLNSNLSAFLVYKLGHDGDGSMVEITNNQAKITLPEGIYFDKQDIEDFGFLSTL
jgi:hypothetical protein